MPRTEKTYPSPVSKMGTQFLFKYPDITPAIRVAAEIIKARRCTYLNANNMIVQADADSPNFFGIPFDSIAIGKGTDTWVDIHGPAEGISQSTLYPLLPLKVAEDGQLTHGVIVQDQNKAIKAASAGETGEVTDSNPADYLTVVSDNALDITSYYVVVFGKETTTGTLGTAYALLTGATLANMVNLYNGSTMSFDYIFGALVLTDPRDFTTVTLCNGNITVAKLGVGDLITFNGAALYDPGMVPIVASADRRKTFNRKVAFTTSTAAADEVFVIGFDNDEVRQYEHITYAATLPVKFQSEYNWSQIQWLAVGRWADVRTVAVDALQSNEFEPCLANAIGNVNNYTATTVAAEKFEVVAEEALDVSITVMVLGENAGTPVCEEVTTNAADGTTPVAMTSNCTNIFGWYQTSSTAATGVIYITRNAAGADILSLEGTTHISAGILVNYGEDAGTGTFTPLEIPGCNSRPVFTCTNVAATDSFMIYGEDVSGTVQSEKGTFVTGVFESVNTWSRIIAIGAVTIDAEESIKVSFEEEDDASSFIGINLEAQTAQAAVTEIFLGALPWQKIYGTTKGREILLSVIGPGGRTDIDTLATSTQTWTFPDSSGIASGHPATVKTVSTAGGGDYVTPTLALAAASDGDTIALLDDAYTTSATITVDKAVNIVSWAGGTTFTAVTGYSLFTVSEVTGTVRFENINMVSADTAATDHCIDIPVAFGGTLILDNCVLGTAAYTNAILIDIANNALAITIEITNSFIGGDNTIQSINSVHDNAASIITIRGSDITGLMDSNSPNDDYYIYESNLLATGVGAEIDFLDVDKLVIENTYIAGELEINDVNDLDMLNVSIYGALDIDEATSAELHKVTVIGATEIADTTLTILNAYNCQFNGTLTIADATDTQVNLFGGYVGGAVGYTETTSLVFTADGVHFGGLVTETSGTFTHTGCIFEGGTSGITTQATASKILNVPGTVRTVGVGCDYPATLVGLTLAQTDSTAGDTIAIYNSIVDIDTQLQLTKALTYIGMSDDTTLLGTIVADSILEITTVAGMEFYNLRFENDSNNVGAFCFEITSFGAKFVNCEFKTAHATPYTLLVTGGANETVELYDCVLETGILTYTGVAATSRFRMHNTNISGGAGAMTTGTMYTFGCQFGAAFTVTSGSAYHYGGDPANIAATAEHFIKTSNIVTIGTGCDYADLATYIGSIAANDTLWIYNLTETMAATLVISQPITMIGMSDDCEITSSVAAGTVSITGANVELHNINIANTNNTAGDIALAITGDGTKFYNCEFNGGTDLASIAIDFGILAGEEAYFHNCLVSDGIIDADGNASSRVYWYNGEIRDAVHLDTGLYYFHDVEFDTTLTTGAVGAANIILDNCRIAGAVVITDSGSFRMKGGNMGGAFTHTAGTLTEISDVTIVGNVSIVAATYIDFANVRFSGTIAETGVIGESFFRDCDLASSFDMNTAAQMAELHNCNVTGIVTIDHASADFEASNCSFGTNVICTSAAAFKIFDGSIAGGLTLTAGTLHELSNIDITGAVSIVASTYIDISNSRFANNIAMSGVVAESYFSNIDVTGTFAQATAAVTTMVISNSRFTGTFGINHADTDLKVFGSYFIGAVTITDADDVYFHNCEFDATFTLTLSDIAEFHDCIFDSNLASTSSGVLVIYDSRITAASVWNHASAAISVFNSEFGGLLTITNAATLLFDVVRFTGTNSLTITDVQTSARIYNSYALDLVTITEGTLIELFNSNFEEFVDDDSDDINVYNCTFSGAVVPDSADWDSYNCLFLSTIDESAATAFDDWGSRIVGVLTQAAGTVTLHGSRVESAVVGTVAGDYDYYTATGIQTIEGALSLKSIIGVCSYGVIGDAAIDVRVSSGFEVLEVTNLATGLEWAHGIGGAGATVGYFEFDAINEYMTFSVPIPDDYCHSGVAADFVVSIYYSSTNATDELDYEFYTWNGTSVEEANDFSINAGPEWIDLGTGVGDHVVQGENLILSIGNVSTGPGAGGATTFDLFAIRITYRVGMSNHS